MIIDRYLIREICSPLAKILSILVALFASYSAANFLSDAVNGLLSTDTIAPLIGLKALISLEVLIPISLYISVLLSFSKLHSDSEFVAIFTMQITPTRVLRSVLTLSAVLAVFVAGLSVLVRPWAYQKLHELSARAEVTMDVDAMGAGTFYVSQNGNRVVFLTHRGGPGSPAQDVFVRVQRGARTQIIYARYAFPVPPTAPNAGAQAYMNDTHIYELGSEEGQADQIMSVQGMVVNPQGHIREPVAYSSLTASSLRLAGSNSAPDIAEFQWRLSTPLSTLLLGLLGVPLSRAVPRQAKYANFGVAILIYAGYYFLCTAARTWVQHGVVASLPGIWWAPLLLCLVLLGAVYWHRPA